MAAESEKKIRFVPMTSILKATGGVNLTKYTDWVATEKVHGSSFQMFTRDGATLHVGSRTRLLDKGGSFLKCNIEELLVDYEIPSLKLWHIVNRETRWSAYRAPNEYPDSDDNDDDKEDNKAAALDNNKEDSVKDSSNDKNSPIRSEESQSKDNDGNGDNEPCDECVVRIYGELFGGGGIEKGVKSAVQKEIIYCDDFRFYVFGITVNYRWTTVSELGYLCEKAGFPYYATPVCEPKSSPEEVKQFLTDNGFIETRSKLTEKEGVVKTFMEGVVITPLVRPDFQLRAVKFLYPDFSDVRHEQFGKTITANLCTKQRYHSVISKLDIPERLDTELVVSQFIADIIKESPTINHQDNMKGKWRQHVIDWLWEDEYIDEEKYRMEKQRAETCRRRKDLMNGEGKKEKKVFVDMNTAESEKKRQARREKDRDVEADLVDGAFGLDLFDDV